MVSRGKTFGVLLLPAIVLGALSYWLLEAKWIGIAVFVVGLVVAGLGSVRPRRIAGLFALLAGQVATLVATEYVGIAIDCSRHCS